MPIITFVWNTFADARSCRKCLALAGYKWRFTDMMPPALIHPEFGVVYDLVADEPRTHGQGIHGCRCWLTVEIDDSDLTKELDNAVDDVNVLSRNLDSILSSVEQFAFLLSGAR